MIKKIVGILVMVLCGLLAIMAAKEYQDIRKENEADELNQGGSKNEVVLWYSFEEYGDYLQYVADMYKSVKDVDVTIKYVGATSEGDMIDAISKANQTGEELPDLYVTSSLNLEEIYLLGLCKENSNERYNRENYSQAALDAITYKDKYYAYPLAYEMSAFVYNKAYVTEEQIPKTFDDIKAYADAFNSFGDDEENAENSENVVDYSKVEDIIVWDTNNVKSNYGFVGDYIKFSGTYAGKDEKVNISKDRFTSAIAYYKEFYEYFSLKDKATGTKDENYEKIVKDFAEGKIVFTILNIKSLKELDGKGVEYGVCPLPMLSTALTTKQLSETDIVVVNPYADDIESAEEFAKYLTFGTTFKMYEMTGMLPAKKMSKYDNEGLAEIAYEYSSSVSFPKLRRLSDYWLKVENLFKSVNEVTLATSDDATGNENDTGSNAAEELIVPPEIQSIVDNFINNIMQ